MSIEVQISKLIEALDRNTTALNQQYGLVSNGKVLGNTNAPVVDKTDEDLSYAQKRKAEIAAEAKAKKEAELKAEADAKAAAKAEKEENRRKQEELRAAEAAKKAAEEDDDFLAAPETPAITLDQVREVMIKLRTQNKDLAFKVLSEAGAGASLLPGSKAINDKTPGNAVLKVENFAAVFEAATKALK